MDELTFDDTPEEIRPDPTEDELRAEHNGWLDANPFYLLLMLDEVAEAVKIDLAERGWIAKHNALGHLRATGRWYLVVKTTEIVLLAMAVLPGEQPYYVARHVGFAKVGGGSETTVYGIGKKRLDGHADRFWIAKNGAVMIGDDVELLALDMLKQGQL